MEGGKAEKRKELDFPVGIPSSRYGYFLNENIVMNGPFAQDCGSITQSLNHPLKHSRTRRTAEQVISSNCSLQNRK